LWHLISRPLALKKIFIFFLAIFSLDIFSQRTEPEINKAVMKKAGNSSTCAAETNTQAAIELENSNNNKKKRSARDWISDSFSMLNTLTNSP
jgi:hypothetical protein